MTERGQITLPKWIRDKMQLKGGETFVPEQDGENIILRRLKIDLPTAPVKIEPSA
ncbi:MAG: AbrB/MazE/SpoVT family DNA-binding domain-containing protein [Candidatus Norongarragalinales archaeon]